MFLKCITVSFRAEKNADNSPAYRKVIGTTYVQADQIIAVSSTAWHDTTVTVLELKSGSNIVVTAGAETILEALGQVHGNDYVNQIDLTEKEVTCPSEPN